MNTIYKLDTNHITLREHRFGTPWWLMPIVLLVRLLRLRMSGSTDDPCVETVAPYEITEAELPDEVWDRMATLHAELEALGFGRPIYHSIPSPHLHTHIYWATFTHRTGKAVARIHYRVWSPNVRRAYWFPQFITEFEDGSSLLSSSGKPDLLAPDSVRTNYQVGASASTLWESHQRQLDELNAHQPKPVHTEDETRALSERLHGRLRDFHLQRGVFQPLSQAEQAALAARTAAAGQTRDDQVLARLAELQRSKPSWLYFMFILVLSGVLFFVAGRWQGQQELVWLFIPVLLFHEMGHYVAMRMFGYRNVRMFFIPFLGAAVAGKHYNVAGWKKAVVALLGPLPGIVLGAVLGVVGWRLHSKALADAALLLVILNGSNLIPFLPFDGGWVLHATLFCRHPLLDTTARVVAIGVILGLGLLTGSWVVYLLALPLALALPVTWWAARVAQRLRQKGGIAVSSDDVTVPPEAARTILAELQANGRTTQPVNFLAQMILNVYENLNARPPGVLATMALLAVYAGGFVAALVLAIVFTAGRMGIFDRWQAQPTDRTPHRYTAGTAREWRGAKAEAMPREASNPIAATFADEEAAGIQFAALSAELPPEASLRLFGATLLLTLPPDREAERNRWLQRLRPQARELSGRQAGSSLLVTLSSQLDSEEEAREMEQQLRAYLVAPRAQFLLPPWSAAWRGLPAPERERFQKARRLLVQLDVLPGQVEQQPEVTALGPQMMEALRAKDMAELQRLGAASQKAREAAEERLLKEWLAEQQDEVAPSLAALWQRERKLAKEIGFAPGDAKERPAELVQLHADMAQYLGTLPLQDDRPSPGSDSEAARSGWVYRQGTTINVSNIQFVHPHSGLPALADWLGQRAVQPIRYGILEDEDDPEE